MKSIESKLNNMDTKHLLENEEPLNPTEKQRIMNLINCQLDQKTKAPHRRFATKKVIACVVACVLVLSAVAVGAATIFPWNSSFSTLFHLDDESKAALSPSGMEINQSVTQNGFTVAAKQAASDAYGTYVIIDVTAPEDMKIEDNYDFGENDTTVNDIDSLFWDHYLLSKANNHATYVFYVSTPQNISGHKVSLSLKNFGYFKDNESARLEDKNQFHSLIDGEWNLSWNVSYQDISKNYAVNKNVKIHGGKAKIKTLSISPYSATITLKEIKPFLEHTHYEERNLTVTMKNGTVYDINNCENLSDNVNVITLTFPKVISVDDISSISYGKLTVPMDTLK